MARTPSTDSQLKRIREQIDKIDLQLHELINQRACCAQETRNLEVGANRVSVSHE